MWLAHRILRQTRRTFMCRARRLARRFAHSLRSNALAHVFAKRGTDFMHLFLISRAVSHILASMTLEALTYFFFLCGCLILRGDCRDTLEPPFSKDRCGKGMYIYSEAGLEVIYALVTLNVQAFEVPIVNILL